ncbi:hypothetical protein MTP99_013237 [Tenebrio molitor]|nr:hypothetical protein MTP99_013237 [Tenebrio molitor]
MAYWENLPFGLPVHLYSYQSLETACPVGSYTSPLMFWTTFFLILYDSFIQISCLRIFNWFDFVSFQKVTYHLARFPKNQASLKNVIFDNNINKHSANYTKLLTSCMGSRATITV